MVGEVDVSEDDDVRREFGAELVSARELHGDRAMTQTDLARIIKTSRSTISRIESGNGTIPREIPGLLDEVFATEGRFKALHEAIVAKGYPAHSRRRLALEPKAHAILEWSPTVVPGLLQTASYAYALLRDGLPRASESEVRHKVQQRMGRQELLRRPSPPDVSVVVCESVLRRRVGEPETMRGQLAALLDFADRPTTLLQVLPLDAGTHGLMDGSLSILTTPREGMTVYTEGIRSGSIVEDPNQVRQLARSYDVLTATALPPVESACLIRKLLEAQ
ncbi:helix-turn-helix transcriptional regulator [Streptomyces koyangensis]|uniref:Helix-turn-helix transcriptional regulator n=1 Tax=Streptomyces koyangensis TaxID=188770 RepID=A0ABX7END2_9ACTN|nr:helix-turn-helix transcriptional regulator [Streptomyces koyangensis]